MQAALSWDCSLHIGLYVSCRRRQMANKCKTECLKTLVRFIIIIIMIRVNNTNACTVYWQCKGLLYYQLVTNYIYDKFIDFDHNNLKSHTYQFYTNNA